jgi:DNA-binding GntR family transcriptional regulator
MAKNAKISIKDRDGSIPFYYQVAETLKDRIISHKYQPNDLLPSESRLSDEFDVSNITIRKAMSLLVKDGLVIRRRGIGTRVVYRKESRIPLKITGNFRDWVDSAVRGESGLTVDVLAVDKIICPQPIAESLGLDTDGKVWCVKRIRKLKREPASYYINYIPVDLVGNLEESDFINQSFIEVFKKKGTVLITKAIQRVEAVVSDMDLSSILGIHFGSALFYVENIYFSADGQPLEMTHVYFRGDRYIYESRHSL